MPDGLEGRDHRVGETGPCSVCENEREIADIYWQSDGPSIILCVPCAQKRARGELRSSRQATLREASL